MAPQATANVVTKLFGENENENLRHSAIPWKFDEWFHGDFTKTNPSTLSDALGTKDLEEYDSSFPDFRINSAIEISFDTDGQTISNASASLTDPDDANSPGSISPITLEGETDEPTNPFRTAAYDYDGAQDYLEGIVKGPHTAQETVGPIGDDNIEGYRASIILGGKDPYLVKLKQDGETLASVTGSAVPAVISRFFAHVTTFYSFLDFVYMADGSKLARVWDASVYPSHALYVDDTWQDQNLFREGIEWVEQGSLPEHTAFLNFGLEGNTPGRTPFDQFGSWGYKTAYVQGSGNHPVMNYRVAGSSLSLGTLEDSFSNPLFPGSLAPI